jgi:hypothetical protein
MGLDLPDFGCNSLFSANFRKCISAEEDPIYQQHCTNNAKEKNLIWYITSSLFSFFLINALDGHLIGTILIFIIHHSASDDTTKHFPSRHR